MQEILNILFQLVEKFGAVGAILLVLVYFGLKYGWKLINNHFHTLQKNVESFHNIVTKDVNTVAKRILRIDRKLTSIDKRLAIQEAVCNERHGKEGKSTGEKDKDSKSRRRAKK